jgi:glycerol kinase
MTEALVLAIDQGTSSTKAVLLDETGRLHSDASVPVGRVFPRPGWVEQDPVEIWESVREALDVVLRDSRCAPVAIAITNQRESILIWDRETGAPMGPLVGWQCRRGAEICEQARESGAASIVQGRTGLPLDPSFSAPKLRWLLDADPRTRAAAEEGHLCAGTVDSWLVWKLTDGAVHITDAGNASRTLLFDLESLAWHEELLGIFEIPRQCLPDVVDSSGIAAEVTAVDSLVGVPIAGIAADSHAALFGLGALEPGTAKATLGTGTSLMTPTGRTPLTSTHGLGTTVAWLIGTPTYALEGNILSSGATLQWVAALLEVDEAGLAALAAEAATSNGVYLVPGFAGLGAPHWDSDARGRIEGLTFGSGRHELALAAYESIGFQLNDLVEATEQELGGRLEQLLIDGGASVNDQLVHLIADLLGRPVLRSVSPHAAAVGAAYLGGLAAGVWSSERRLSEIPRRFDTFEPRADDSLAARHQGWRAAIGSLDATGGGVDRREVLPT